MQCAIFLKNRFGAKNYQRNRDATFSEGQSFIFNALIEKYASVILSKNGDKRICDHISITMGVILRCNIETFCTQNESMPEDEKFSVINNQMLACMQSLIQGSPDNAIILRHLSLILENSKTSDFQGVFKSTDFKWLIDQLSGEGTLK